MWIRLSDPTLLDDLETFLLRAECSVRRAGVDRLEVEVPSAPGPEQARRELELYLAGWRARHPGAEVEIE